MLLVIARNYPGSYGFARHNIADPFDQLHVVFDRRREERRRHKQPVEVERRRQERRQRDIAESLRTVGWALLR
jgi:hypothetical protein